MQDLKEVTQDFHYENYRAQRLSTPPGSPGVENKTKKVYVITPSILVLLPNVFHLLNSRNKCYLVSHLYSLLPSFKLE